MTTLEFSIALNKKHKNVIELIRKNMQLFEQLGELKQICIKNNKGKQTIIYVLNDMQLKLLLQKTSVRSDVNKNIDIFGIKEKDVLVLEVRHEIQIKRILESIVNGFSNSSIMNLRLKQQYSIGKYIIDIVIESKIQGEYIPILAIEIDEEISHKYTKEKDLLKIQEAKEFLIDLFLVIS